MPPLFQRVEAKAVDVVLCRVVEAVLLLWEQCLPTRASNLLVGYTQLKAGFKLRI